MKNKWRKWVVLTAFSCSFVFSPSLFAQTKTTDLKTLSVKVDEIISTNQKNYRDVAQAMNLLTQIQQEFQSIRGAVEASKVLEKESDKVYQDLDIRVSVLEDKINQIHQLLKEMRANPTLSATSVPQGNSPQAKTKDSSQALKEIEDFQSLLNLINAEDYRAAAAGFMGFLRKYPTSSYAGSAQYWVAESFYSMGDFTKAISEFQVLIDKYPQDPKVKEAIYKQGSAFMRLKKYNEAKLFFQKTIATYPDTAEALHAQARLLQIGELEQNAALAAAPKPTPTSTPRVQSEPIQPASSTNVQPPPSSARPDASTHRRGAPLF